MSVLTEAMRDGAKKIYNAYQGKDKKWHGFEEVNHPKPSGAERWIITYEDKRGWDTPEEAICALKEILNKAN